MIASVAREPGGGLIVSPQATFFIVHRDRIVELAARYRVPAACPQALFTRAGGLISYGLDAAEQLRQVASYVDRILKGAHPGELPVQLPSKMELVINLKTANALGLDVARPLLLIADEVIE